MSLAKGASSPDIDWSKFPSMYPPIGETSNFIDPYTERSSIWITSAICTLIVTVAVFARLYTKLWLVKAVHFEDYLLGASWITYIIGIPFFCLEGWQGAGAHQWNVTIAQSFELLKFANICEAMYCLNVVFAKLAILLQMKRVLAGSSRNLVWWLTVILIWIVLAFYTAAFFMVIFACVPREKIWQPWLEGTCQNEVLGDMIAGAFNLGTDVLMLLLPIFAIFKLGIPMKQRLLVCAVFSTGLLACVFSALRVYYGLALLHTMDRTYALIPAACVSLGEGTALTVIICFPTIRLLILHLLGKAPIQPERSESMQQLRAKVVSPISMSDSDRSGSSLTRVVSPISRSDSERTAKSLNKAAHVYRGDKW